MKNYEANKKLEMPENLLCFRCFCSAKSKSILWIYIIVEKFLWKIIRFIFLWMNHLLFIYFTSYFVIDGSFEEDFEGRINLDNIIKMRILMQNQPIYFYHTMDELGNKDKSKLNSRAQKKLQSTETNFKLNAANKFYEFPVLICDWLLKLSDSPRSKCASAVSAFEYPRPLIQSNKFDSRWTVSWTWLIFIYEILPSFLLEVSVFPVDDADRTLEKLIARNHVNSWTIWW